MVRKNGTQHLGAAAFGLVATLVAATAAMSFQPAQKAAPAAAAQEEATSEPVGEWTLEAAMELGETLYARDCASCHGANGEGPARVFAGNANLKHTVLIASQIVFGGEFMPRFDMTDEEAAAVGTYIRNSWGNDFGIVTPEDIAMYR